VSVADDQDCKEGDSAEGLTIFERIIQEAKAKREAFEGHYGVVKGKRFKELLDSTTDIDNVKRRRRNGSDYGYGKYGKF
jgi:poly-beta-hydroxyalkanoate depolymerase